MALLRALAALLLLAQLTGCIVLPVGHRHRHGYQRDAVVVVPAPRHAYPDEHRDYPRRGR